MLPRRSISELLWRCVHGTWQNAFNKLHMKCVGAFKWISYLQSGSKNTPTAAQSPWASFRPSPWIPVPADVCMKQTASERVKWLTDCTLFVANMACLTKQCHISSKFVAIEVYFIVVILKKIQVTHKVFCNIFQGNVKFFPYLNTRQTVKGEDTTAPCTATSVLYASAWSAARYGTMSRLEFGSGRESNLSRQSPQPLTVLSSYPGSRKF
jgi:hypothetical protein